MLKIVIKESAGSSSTPLTLQAKEDLLNLIQQHSLRDAVIETIPASAIDWLRGSTLSDTEGSGSSKEQRERKRIGNYTKQKMKPINNYISAIEDISPQKLAEHAQQIHAELSERSSAATTILCVALKSSDNGIKKIVFCNSTLMTLSLRAKAEQELGYHVFQAEQAHAEGEFLQFLWARRKKNEYTHLVAMGCSRLHCAECNALLELVLGKGYTEISAAINQEDGVVSGAQAVDTKKYTNYYIPSGLQKFIEALTGKKLACRGRYVSPSRSLREDKPRVSPDLERIRSLRPTEARKKARKK